MRPRTPWHETVIYEVHVKGFTKLREQCARTCAGTYGGLASAGAIDYLKSLGVTAVELLPIHHIADEGFLHDRGLTNYWGYSTIGYLAPHSLYAATRRSGARVQGHGQGAAPRRHRGDPRRRLQPHRRGQPPRADAQLPRRRQPELLPAGARRPALLHGLHRHGQHAQPGAPDRAAADHGLAAVLRDRLPRRRLPLRSRVGARARVLRGRSPVGVLRHHPPGSDPVPGEADRRAVGRRPGRLPGRQLPDPLVGVERHLPRHDARLLARTRAAARLRVAVRRLVPTSTRRDGRRPFASVNFITAHDGFTLRDLVSYNDKHNEANGEGNRDGTDDNRSWNCGVEGATDDPAINALRARQQRNFLATLLLSQGVPMLLGGDELGRTQGGNNNAWCQDNEISWFDWSSRRRGAARVHAPADRAAPRASRLPPHEVLRRQRRASAGRLVDAARRPPHDAARLGQHRVAGDRRVPERRRAWHRDAATGRRCATIRSCCSSTRSSRRSRSGCRRAASARAGSSCSRPGRLRMRTAACPGARRRGRVALDRAVPPA